MVQGVDVDLRTTDLLYAPNHAHARICQSSKQSQSSCFGGCLEQETRAKFAEIIGDSPALMTALNLVSLVAPTDSSVMIQGETGTGKELIARAIHDLSGRRER